jgi:hypothetical protein
VSVVSSYWCTAAHENAQKTPTTSLSRYD